MTQLDLAHPLREDGPRQADLALKLIFSSYSYLIQSKMPSIKSVIGGSHCRIMIVFGHFELGEVTLLLQLSPFYYYETPGQRDDFLEMMST